MSRALPSRPDVRHLKDEAKRRLRSGEFFRLAEAQRAIAVEHGLVSWPRLVAAVEARRLDAAGRADALVEAALSEDPRRARELLAADPSLGSYDVRTRCVTHTLTAVPGAVDPEWLVLACCSRLPGDALPAARLLVGAGADVNAVREDGGERYTPLYGAAGIRRDVELTRLLLAAGADPDEGLPEPDPSDALAVPWGSDALYHAAYNSSPDCVRLLLGAGPHPVRVSFCLLPALDQENPAMVRTFLEHGADPDQVPTFGNRQAALVHAVIRDRSAEVVGLLLAAGAAVDLADGRGRTAYRHAVRQGRTDLASLLLEHGADPGRATEEDRRLGALLSGASVEPRPVPADLLTRAAGAGDLTALRRLLAAGADPNAAAHGMPALHEAGWHGRSSAVRLLLAAGADPATRNTYGGDALGSTLHGSLHGPAGDHVGAVRALLDVGVVPPPDPYGSDEARAFIASYGQQE